MYSENSFVMGYNIEKELVTRLSNECASPDISPRGKKKATLIDMNASRSVSHEALAGSFRTAESTKVFPPLRAPSAEVLHILIHKNTFGLVPNPVNPLPFVCSIPQIAFLPLTHGWFQERNKSDFRLITRMISSSTG
jgi:hypothetical protein